MDCLLVIVLRGWDVLKENQVKKGRKSKHQSKGKKKTQRQIQKHVSAKGSHKSGPQVKQQVKKRRVNPYLNFIIFRGYQSLCVFQLRQ